MLTSLTSKIIWSRILLILGMQTLVVESMAKLKEQIFPSQSNRETNTGRQSEVDLEILFDKIYESHPKSFVD